MQEKYANRPDHSVPLAVSIDRRAAEILCELCPGKSKGRFVARLVHEHVAREKERERLEQVHAEAK